MTTSPVQSAEITAAIRDITANLHEQHHAIFTTLDTAPNAYAVDDNLHATLSAAMSSVSAALDALRVSMALAARLDDRQYVSAEADAVMASYSPRNGGF